MKLSQVAAQLYTCRDTLGNAPDIAKTLSRLRGIGYTAVQASGLGPISYEEFDRILKDTGMVCCATHESPDNILNSPHKVVERLRTLGCKITAYPFPHGIDLSNRKSVDGWIAQLQRAGEVIAEAGQILCYHNHNVEFRKLDGRVILDLIYGGTALQGELDTYWVQYGGGEITAWCGKLSGRMPIIHLKDYQTTSENKPIWCEIGAGVLDFASIIPAAEKAGCEWFVVEQDTCPGDPVDSLAASWRYIEQHLAR